MGKDYVAARIPGGIVLKMAEPVYALVEWLTGWQVDKAAPGGRRILQQLGNWGRAVVSDDYPMSAERAVATSYIRQNVPFFSEFGARSDFWAQKYAGELDRFFSRHPTQMAVCTDVRFPEEAQVIHEDGYIAAVLCCPATLERRRLECQYAKPDRVDVSEVLATSLMESLYNADRLAERLAANKIDHII